MADSHDSYERVLAFASRRYRHEIDDQTFLLAMVGLPVVKRLPDPVPPVPVEEYWHGVAGPVWYLVFVERAGLISGELFHRTLHMMAEAGHQA